MDSYEEILKRMKDKYRELSGVDVPELSDIDIRMKVLAGEIYNDELNLDFIKRQMFVGTAVGEYLEMHGKDRNIERKGSVKATGKVRFTIPEGTLADVTVPKGTIVSTAGDTAVRFITDEDCIIEAGSTYEDVNATAELGGRQGNVAPNRVSVIVTTAAGVENVSNPNAFIGGENVESDLSLRKRILDSYNRISNGTNAAYYESLALSVPGVSKANVVPKVRGVGTVNVYICDNNRTPSSNTISKVQQLMDKQRELNVDVLVSGASGVNIDLSVAVKLKKGYDISTVADKIKNAVGDYISTLSIGEDVLESHLGRVVLDVEGVYDYTWSVMVPSSYIIARDKFPILKSITVEEEF